WQIVETTCGIPSSASCPNGFRKETDAETLSMALNIFPQPAQTQMNIKLQPYLEGSINVSILNIFGQSVLTVESNGSD
ncbi:hypothetical protein P0P51_08510, partial [Campylobacter jejuni]|uniref:hypothetical protein n=1 Tax=Campylobacter jejuni TaxID=197 RepID=UPI002F96467E